jgi:hypothetical protein
VAVATAAAVTVVVLHLAAVVIRPEAGPVGLLQVGAAHLSIAALLLAPVALQRDARAARVAFAGLIVVTAVRFGDAWTSFGEPRLVSLFPACDDRWTWHVVVNVGAPTQVAGA